MKTMAKENKANKKLVTKRAKLIQTEELETEPPLSEKDEVKKAENDMNEFGKKHP